MAGRPTWQCWQCWQCCCWLKFAESRSILSQIENVILRCIHVTIYSVDLIITSLGARRSQTSNQILFCLFKNWCSFCVFVESFLFLNPIFLSLPNKYFQKNVKITWYWRNVSSLTWQSRVQTKELVKMADDFMRLLTKKNHICNIVKFTTALHGKVKWPSIKRWL